MSIITNLAVKVSGQGQFIQKLVYLCLFLLVLLNCYTVSKYLYVYELDFDAATYYLPYAKEFLNDGLKFFSLEKSLRYPPMAYVYPALLGAKQSTIIFANIALSCVITVLLYRIGQLIHSCQAGLCIALLFALSPIFHEFIPRVLTEPLFIFLVCVWFWCVAEIVVNQSRQFILLFLGGIAFGLAILTRGSFYYFLILMIAATGVFMLRTNGDQRRIWKSLLLMHWIAMIFPLIFIGKNWFFFEYPFFATGMGNALYFGSHPLTGGYELPVFGLFFDDGGITMEHDHLSVTGDRLLKGVALTILSERFWTTDLFAAYMQKTGAFIFVSKIALPDTLWNIRSFRIMEVILGVIGLLSIRIRPIQLLISGIFIYQIAVHVPLLYVHRYSVGAIDVWLVILAGVGLATLLDPKNLKTLIMATLIILIAVAIGELHRKYSRPLSPRIDISPHQIIWHQDGNNLIPIGNVGFTPAGPGKYRLNGEPNSLDIPVRGVQQLNPFSNFILSLRLQVTSNPESKCQKFRVLFKRLADSNFTDSQSINLKIEETGKIQDYHVGASIPLKLNSDGDIRLVFECPFNTQIAIDSLSIAESQVALKYKQLYFNNLN